MVKTFGKHSTPFVLVCMECDGFGLVRGRVRSTVPSAKVALDTGWEQLKAENGRTWNYIGLCPECVKEREVADV